MFKLPVFAVATALQCKMMLPPKLGAKEKTDQVKDSYIHRTELFTLMATVVGSAHMGFYMYAHQLMPYVRHLIPFSLMDESTSLPLYQRPWTTLELVSLGVVVSAAALRWWSFRTLGRYFTFVVTIRKDHDLVKEGPYSVLRHPSYTGLLLGIYGYVYLCGFRGPAVWSLLLSISIAITSLRIHNEEAVLKEHFKQKWDDYCKTRWRLIPFVF
eukprot:Colp12_sorted_trinity150504_noHs@17483